VYSTHPTVIAIELAGILGDYNEGLIGPGHCPPAVGCGLGFELVFLLPPLIWQYRRRRSPAAGVALRL
jgi:hypothetical protein